MKINPRARWSIRDERTKISKDSKELYEISDVQIENVTGQKFLVLDVEATGLDVERDYITDFACVPVVNGEILAEKAFSSLVNSPVPIPSKIEGLTGISNEDIAKAPQFKKIIKEVLAKYRDYIWIGQCGLEFDFPMIRNICEKEGIAFSPKTMDTKVLFAFLNQESKETFSTDFFKSHFLIDSSDLKRHTGLGDTLLIARILKSILDLYEKRGIREVRIKKPLVIRKFIPQKL